MMRSSVAPLLVAAGLCGLAYRVSTTHRATGAVELEAAAAATASASWCSTHNADKASCQTRAGCQWRASDASCIAASTSAKKTKTVSSVARTATVSDSSPEVYYYRRHNYDSSKALDILGTDDESAHGSVTLRLWKATFSIFDSPTDVRVQRLDLSGPPDSELELFPSSLRARGLHLTAGPVWLFSDATLTIEDSQSGATTVMAYEAEPTAWISQNSCVRLRVQLGATAAASIFVVSSGVVNWETSDDDGADDDSNPNVCKASTIKVGTALDNNPAQYTLSEAASCTNVSMATHASSPDYSLVDEPVGSLAAHYHTRGALNFVLYGTTTFNDGAGVVNDTLTSGELRFVDAGVYYGPEAVGDGTYMASVHEPDPAAVRTSPVAGASSSQCPFACFDEADGSQTMARCIHTQS